MVPPPVAVVAASKAAGRGPWKSPSEQSESVSQWDVTYQLEMFKYDMDLI